MKNQAPFSSHKVRHRVTHGWMHLICDESGQDLIEYALIASLIALSAVVAMKALTTSIGGSFSRAGTALTGAV